MKFLPARGNCAYWFGHLCVQSASFVHCCCLYRFRPVIERHHVLGFGEEQPALD